MLGEELRLEILLMGEAGKPGRAGINYDGSRSWGVVGSGWDAWPMVLSTWTG